MVVVQCGKDFKNTLTFNELTALVEKIKVVIYVRVSTEDQAKHGYSLESQIDRCVEKAKSEFSVKDDEIYAVVEAGDMGDNPNRAAMNYALYLLENGVGRMLFMLHPDRMSRELKLQHLIADRVWNAGCTLEFVESPLDPENPESMLMFNIQGSIAQYNKAKINANSKRGRRQKAKNGKIPGMRRLYGYTFDKEKDILVENSEEKKWYQQMVEWALYGKDGVEMNLNDIARALSLLGVPAPNGDIWFRQTVSRILRNEVYLGIFYFGKTETKQKSGKKYQIEKPRDQWLEIEIPAYITQEKYDALQKKLEGNHKYHSGKPSEFTMLLKGLARCGRCGGACVNGSRSVDKKTGEIRYVYYTCVNKPTKGFKVGTANRISCRGRNWRQDVIDSHVWNFISERLRNPNKIIAEITEKMGDSRKVEEIKKKKESLEEAISEKEKAVERYNDLFAYGRIKTVEELEKKVQPIESDLNELKEQLSFVMIEFNSLSSTYDTLKQIKEHVEIFQKGLLLDDLSDEQKQFIIRTCVKRVVLHESKIEIITTWGIDPIASSGGKNNHGNLPPYSNQSQHLGTVMVVNSKVDFTEARWGGGDYKHKWEHLIPQLDKLVLMYWGDLMEFEQIGINIDEDWWTIKELFKQFNVPRMTTKERAKYKRELDYQTIHDLHIVKGMSLNQIYREYKFSPPYSRLVLKEGEEKGKGISKIGQPSHL